MSKKGGFTLVEIMIVVLVISIMLAIAVPSWLKVRETSNQTACDDNRRVINQAKQMWIQDQGKVATDTATAADLAPYMKSFPKCPENGIYTIGNGNAEVHCSIHYP
ncbi:MAG: prepilin-type N-terminal cleavage/methylation domain-containing protein [Fimbriimonadaceae bacterium]|nr:prepilin-type N-terminal cleavage/methylation domain-containing protein [Fimbriimonadaceae bacterium]